jgi:CRISPR/Cas system-associated protein endoribonuclease Cas2
MFAFSKDIKTEVANTNTKFYKKGGYNMKKFMVLMHLISGTCAASFVLYFVRKNSSEHRSILMSVLGTQLLSWVLLLITSMNEKAKP